MARILIVETQTNVRHTLVNLLEQAGHSATAVATLAEAFSILAVDVPDLLATDVVLTDGSSTSLAKQAQMAGAKTLMMTGSSSLMVPDNRTCQSRFRPRRSSNGSSRFFWPAEYGR
jgi:DNA-binding NtrC family response regulator